MSTQPDPPIHSDHGTFLVARAIDAEQLGPPPIPTHVTLPGALAAIPHDTLLAHQDFGRAEHQIVAAVNAQWEHENADRLTEHKRWVAGSYTNAIQAMRDAEARAAAEQQRKQAEFQQRLQEG